MCPRFKKKKPRTGDAITRPGANVPIFLKPETCAPSEIREGASNPCDYLTDTELSVNATLTCLPLPTDTGAGWAGVVVKFTP